MTTIQDVMTPNPTVCTATTSLADAAKAMRDQNIGDVLVERDGTLCGIVTDRDIVVRSVAEGQAPTDVRLGDICQDGLVSLAPGDAVEHAVQLMRDKALRRLPVCDGGQAIGIVSLGDLAMRNDPGSALADISEEPPNN